MSLVSRILPALHNTRKGDLPKLVAMMGLFFLVVCAVGILRPIKNALALDGLGATDFYKVYLVSAAVVLFVVPYNRLAERVPWRWLIPGVAGFFALNLVLFRVLYQEGSATYGMLFYGWYDLFAAALVSQFFMATQLFFNARNAKQAYPLVIAGGALGASLGGAITGFFAKSVGTPNLLLVAAALIVVFGIGLPLVWAAEPPPEIERPGVRRREKLTSAGLRTVFRNPQVRLIGASVLLTIVVKQLVDYQFNAITADVFETRDAISAFQGKFNAATQWLPIVVVLVLRPLMTRWGVGVAVFLLPASMLVTTFGIALWPTLAMVTAAKAAETSLRYSAERTGREILYVPVPEDIKMKAKAYIDVAVEKGIGKVASAGLIFMLLMVMNYRQVGWVAAGLSVLWIVLTGGIRREYIRSLARSIEGRFASLRGVFASLADASTLPVVQGALASRDVLQTAFALDLIDQAGPADTRPFAHNLHALLDHPSHQIRTRTLAVLAKHPEAMDPVKVRARLSDTSEAVRESAVRALCAGNPAGHDALVRELLHSPEAPVRTAALACLARGEISGGEAAVTESAYLHERWQAAPGDVSARLELALAAGTLRVNGKAEQILSPLLQDPEPAVVSAALRSAGLLGRADFYPRMIAALKSPGTREAAREALAMQGTGVLQALSAYLMDETADPVVRRNIPSVLGRIPAPATVNVLLKSFLAPETDQLLDFRTLKVLNRLRARHPDLDFDAEQVNRALEREVQAARQYSAAQASIRAGKADGKAATLLARALEEGWRERREAVFRCLGLLHPPDGMYRCYLVVVGGRSRARANALEWLEHTVGHAQFARLSPVLDEDEADGGSRSKPENLFACLGQLRGDGDPWIARCATSAAIELGCGNPEDQPTGSNAMDPIEKVFLLQQVDLLRGARSAHLALLASIAEEVEVDAGTMLLQRDEPTGALYVVIHGSVEMQGVGGQLLLAEDGTAFGTWALIDEAPSLVSARAVKPSRLLRIGRSDFYDLLADHPELAMGLLQGLARRVRSLVA